jgi:hypothetical protein
VNDDRHAGVIRGSEHTPKLLDMRCVVVIDNGITEVEFQSIRCEVLEFSRNEPLLRGRSLSKD